MKLISMTDFILNQEQPTYLQKEEFEEAYYKLHNYANFLLQPLTLGMFVPCDENGNVMRAPKDVTFPNAKCANGYKNQYQQAKERVLFEGFEIEIETHDKNISSIKDKNGLLNVMWNFSDARGWVLSRGLKTVEDLILYNLTLTESAKQQLKQ